VNFSTINDMDTSPNSDIEFPGDEFEAERVVDLE
jgi:hypothetical protein